MIVVLALPALLLVFLSRTGRLDNVKAKTLQLFGLPRRQGGEHFNADYEAMNGGGMKGAGSASFMNSLFETERALDPVTLELPERQSAQR